MTLPGLEAARCVHALLPNAGCSACVDACPRDAWALDDSALRFTAEACDGCGLCVPACPQQAIRLPLRFEPRTLAGASALLARCEFSSGEGELGLVPCLHAIGLMDLLRARQRGQSVWLTRRGDCERCEREQGERLEARVTALNAALAERGQPLVLLREVSAAAWKRLLDEPSPRQSGASRRGFFGALGKRPVTALLKDSIDVPDEKPLAPGEFLSAKWDGVLPWHIRLDASRCTGCHACARVCPQGAIEQGIIEQDGGEVSAYRLRHPRCTGCGLCRDVCESNAVSPQSWGTPTVDEVRLQTQRCSACGLSFEIPAVRGSVSLCWVCSRAHSVRHKRKVYS